MKKRDSVYTESLVYETRGLGKKGFTTEKYPLSARCYPCLLPRRGTLSQQRKHRERIPSSPMLANLDNLIFGIPQIEN
ncbi:hypothetical protein FDUTEX481_05904 [Tolypothrix sp. PCC 7601]|nr:hypothetical protein FDUTEX481_05904 [Tolypothrix sp. PCC 7601]BAY92983.1 hypothetical protein NIES3275_50200 [Microchaete diplosiphon NIES-3275]